MEEDILYFKGVIHFKKNKTFADNLLTPMSSKMSMSFFFSRFLMKTFRIFLNIMHFTGNQTVQGFSANCKLFNGL